MSSVPILVCDCGKRLRAPGAVPGRVGRCPSCGGTMRVPEADAPRNPAARGVGADRPSVSPEEGPGAAAPVRKKKKKRKISDRSETAIWDGLMAAPTRPEQSLRESLLYPLWGSTGVASLVVLPPLLWITSIPVVGGLIAVFTGGGSPAGLLGLLMFIPTGLGLFAVLGYTLLFLGRVLASSAIGELHHPRWPDFELSAIGFGLGRWLWAGLVGGVVGGIPALVYWVECGDVDFFDVVILTELSAAGSVYALMALLASILHEDIKGANPVMVFGAIWKLGWGYAQPCLVCGAAVVFCGTLMMAAFEVANQAASAFLVWVFWVAWLYASMVSLRVMGLYYGRNSKRLGWFRGRTGWNV